MAVLFGHSYSKEELLRRVGNGSQVCGISRRELRDGRARGVQQADVWTGSGLEFSVNLSRGMGMGSFRYKGMPFGWISSTGDVAPWYYEPAGGGLDRSYSGGLMHMAGLRQVGASCVDEGEELGLHGRVCNIPAESVHTGGEWDGDEYRVFVQGILRETSALGENLVMTRRISARLGGKDVEIRDTVQNEGTAETPFMILYHTNFGFPLIDEGSRLIIPVQEVRDGFSGEKVDIDRYSLYGAPKDDAGQQIFFHRTREKGGWSGFIMANRRLGMAVRVDYLKKNLPELVNWGNLHTRHYVVEVGPSNCKCFGRAAERKAGTLQFLKPGEKMEFEVRFTVLEGAAELSANETALME